MSVERIKARDVCTKRMMWAIVDKVWTKKLAEWIGDRTVLEVMAGVGWLAKALDAHGVKITATDNYTWSSEHHRMNAVLRFPVESEDAVRAVRKYSKADVLIVSWPEYDDWTILRVAKTWGAKRPIVYIGEHSGCNAPAEFFKYFKKIKNHPDISLASWDGIHDEVIIGHYDEGDADVKG